MTYEIATETAAARPIAAVRRQVPVGEVSTAWRPALDEVWAFLRRHDGLRTDGHNIFVYHHPIRPGDQMEVDFGVEVTGPFEAEDEVIFTHTPAGPVASTLHVGPFDGSLTPTKPSKPGAWLTDERSQALRGKSTEIRAPILESSTCGSTTYWRDVEAGEPEHVCHPSRRLGTKESRGTDDRPR